MFYKSLVVMISLGFLSQVAYYFTAKKRRKCVSGPREIHEVLLFSYGSKNLRKSKYSRVMISAGVDRLLYYLSSPRKTLDICMYVLTNSDIANVIMKLHVKGVRVRMIVDADMAYATGSYVKKMEKHGIAVRWTKSGNLMHHKFCLIDACDEDEHLTPLVMMGSLNWTNQGLSGNWEDVTVTSQKQIVEPYLKEFMKLWTQFQPVV